MPETPQIAVAILNWNGKALLERFLPSVSSFSKGAQLYVIDNASTDNSQQYIADNWPQVRWIANPDNSGYAGGYNKGLSGIKEEFVVLLNSDIEVTENWLTPLLVAMQEHPKLAALQPKIKDLKKQDFFEYAGAAGGFIDYLGYPFCRGRFFYEQEKDTGQYDNYREVFWASGACLLVRKSAFDEVGGLNEVLFAHMEEIDLCWRFQQAGYSVGCEPKSAVYHLGGGTLDKQNERKTFLNFRNNMIILFLNLPSTEAFFTIFIRLVLDGVAAIKFLIDRQPKHCLAVLRAHFAFYRLFPKLARMKSRETKLPMKQLKGVYQKSLVEAFFLRKNRKFSTLDPEAFTKP
jgi:GT2 family glycosyltransferase